MIHHLHLENAHLSLGCAPELGGRIHTCIDRRTGRDWLWKRPEEPRLFAPGDPLDFTTGCFAGLDECLPTVAACLAADGRTLPDHGALWARPWQVCHQEAEVLELQVACPEWGWQLRRRIRLAGATVHFAYTLTNSGPAPAAALWAMHPLLTWMPGDRLELAPAVDHLQASAAQPAFGDRRVAWPEPAPGLRLDALALADNHNGYLKAFTPRLGPTEAWARLHNPERGEHLLVRWDPTHAPHLGLWLTRGGYRAWHHLALEPTFAPCDSLAQAIATGHGPALTLAPNEVRRWEVSWELGPWGQT